MDHTTCTDELPQAQPSRKRPLEAQPDNEKHSKARGMDPNFKIQRRQPECRILVYNLAKKHNIGTMLRSACAFGLSEIVVVSKKKNDISAFGNKGTKQFLHFVYFDTVEEALSYLREDGFRIVGLEIKDGASLVSDRPFQGNTCFVFGNEGSGLNEKISRECDDFVYIRQVGVGTASLNVAVAASIALHHFCEWAGYQETKREGEKFVVDNTQRIGAQYKKWLSENKSEEPP